MKDFDVDIYTLEVGRKQGDFLVVAAEYGFDFFKGAWVTLGRFGRQTEAEVLVTERWHGLRGTIATGCYHEGGGYAGLCERSSLVLRDEDENMWAMTGGPEAAEVLTEFLLPFAS
jgi:hypothetical protein